MGVVMGTTTGAAAGWADAAPVAGRFDDKLSAWATVGCVGAAGTAEAAAAGAGAAGAGATAVSGSDASGGAGTTADTDADPLPARSARPTEPPAGQRSA